MSGHGAHWKCVYESVERFTAELLPQIYRRLVDKGEVAGPNGDPELVFQGRNSFLGYFDPAGEIRHLMLNAVNHEEKTLSLITAYPYATKGVTHPIEVTEVVEWPNGIEAQIRGTTTGGALIAFFDPLYFMNKDRYKPGDVYDFSISALAYQARRAPGEFIDVPVEGVRDFFGPGEAEDGETVQISTRGLAALLPVDSGDIDDFVFQAPVAQPRTVAFEGRPVHRVRATLMRPDENDFDVMLYLSEHVLDEPAGPLEGEDLAGVLWLQGYLAEPNRH